MSKLNDILAILAAVRTLSEDELRLLNKSIVEQIKHKNTVRAHAAGANINIGDVVSFDGGRRRGVRYLRVEGFNRARTSVKGPETNALGEVMPFGDRWTVANNLCTKVNVKAK